MEWSGLSFGDAEGPARWWVHPPNPGILWAVGILLLFLLLFLVSLLLGNVGGVATGFNRVRDPSNRHRVPALKNRPKRPFPFRRTLAPLSNPF